jgi:hypothetical protein
MNNEKCVFLKKVIATDGPHGTVAAESRCTLMTNQMKKNIVMHGVMFSFNEVRMVEA